MPKVTNKIGPNSYCITVTQGTVADQLLDSILDIVKIQADNKPAHGWTIEKVDSNITIAVMGVSHTFIRLAWLKGFCEDGVTAKYVLLGVKANIIITMISSSLNPNSIVNLLPFSAYVNHSSSVSYLGEFDNWMYIPPNDRYDMMVFIHPRWFATTCMAYSTKELTVFASNGNVNFNAFGLIGAFEVYDSAYGVKQALLNTAQVINGEQRDNVSTERSLTGIAFDQYLFRNKPNINLCPKGEAYNGSNGVTHVGAWSRALKNTDCTMTDIYKLVAPSGLRYGSLFGIKLGGASQTKLMGINFVKCETTNYSIDVNALAVKHLCIPSWFQSNLNAQFNDNRKATFFMPA